MHRKRKRKKNKDICRKGREKTKENRKKKSIEKYKNSFSQNHRQVSYFLKQSTKSHSRSLNATFICIIRYN